MEPSAHPILPTFPIDIWAEIEKYLELEDAFNLYRARFTTYDFKINEYLPLLRIQEWKGDIRNLYDFCGECSCGIKLYRDLGIKSESDSDSDSDDYDSYYDDSPSLGCQNFIDTSNCDFIYLRNFVNVAYKYKLKVPKLIDLPVRNRRDEDVNCVFLKVDLTSQMKEEIYKQTFKFYCDVVQLKTSICTKCGYIDHEEHDKECLFSSPRLRDEWLEEKRLRREKKIRRLEQKRLKTERKLRRNLGERFNAIACMNCCCNSKSSRCKNALCGGCCSDTTCHIHYKKEYYKKYGRTMPKKSVGDSTSQTVCSSCKAQTKYTKCCNRLCYKCCEDVKCLARYHGLIGLRKSSNPSVV